MKFKRDYIKIENLNQFLIKELKHYHPDDPRHTPYWASIKRNCIEGLWGKEFGGFRYMPGRLFFYGNFGTILDVDEQQNIRSKVKPLIRDIEWERAYMVLEADGFSGWSDDDEYTSDEWALELKKTGLPDSSKINNWKKEKRNRFFSLINNEGKLKKYLSPRDNIRKIHEKEKGVPLYWNPTKNISELGCLHKDTKVRMYDGTTKKAIDIQIGDKLIGPDSEPRIVQNLVRGQGIMYDVSTRYGDTYRVTDSHIHRIRKHFTPSQKGKNWKQKDLNLDTNQILDKDKSKLKRQYEAIIQGVEYKERELFFDPYFIGYWLGDRFSSEKMISYNEDDKIFIEPWLINYATENNWDYDIKEEPQSGNYLGTKKMFRFTLNTGKNDYWNTTFKNNKHIPNEYLINSKKNRLKLLAGLLDSNGNYDKNRFKFYNSNFDLIKQVQELSRSLGFKTTISKRQKGIKNSIGYYLQIIGDIHTIPTIYPQKKAKKTNKQAYYRNHINIDYTSGKIEPFYGFEVDKDNLFLLEDFTVTHNARGGGKSYFYSIAVILHTLIFDGVKYYTQENINNPPKAELCVGSGQANKSSDFCKKIEDSMMQLAVDNNLGAWGKFGDEDYEPSIFYKEMAGTLGPNNKAKNSVWRHEYTTISNGREIIKGTGSYVAHVVYSPNKPDGAEAAAGGRYNYIIYEEQGLCFGKGTKIRMSNGSVKNVEEIGIGDYVLGADGSPKKVISIYEGVDNLYKISQTFGQNYIVNSKHRLRLYEKYNKANKYHTITPEEFLKWSNARKRETYGFKNKELQFDKKDLLIDPYSLGIWLGNSDESSTKITTIDYEKSKNNILKDNLTNLNVFNNKYIPIDYLFSSTDQRLQLLAGLIDANGHLVFKGKPAQKFEIYISKNKEFVDQIEFLVTSLGLKCTVREIKTRKKYTISITGDITKIPVKIERKKPVFIVHKKDHLKTSLKVEPIGFGEYFGFALENDDLFLLKDGTVVHNTPLLVKAWGSNKSTVAVGARQFGVQIALGTSGNMDTIQPAKEIFTHPKEFNLVTFDDVWEESGEIGFFLPAYMTATDFKDENGNTDYEEAISFYLKQREVAEASNNPHILAIEKMNNPLIPSDMWQSNTGNILPVAEAQMRERGLLNNKLYEKNYTPIKLYWDSNKPRGVGYEIDKSKKPFFEHKYRYEREDLDGPIMIYEFPQEIHGVVPNDMYKFIGHDPYVSDNMDEGDSLGATYIIMNPKYATQGFSGNCIVASYIGKPHGGRKEYYQNLEKLLAFYGDPIRGLWFEANRGDECKNYFVNRDKQHLLALRPQNINNANIYQKKITQYGYIVGQSNIQKADLIDKVHDWLLEPTTIGSEKLLNIERIPDLFLIRQIIAFDMRTGNYDAVMALAGAVLGIREEERTIIDEIKNKRKHNPLTFLSQNNKMFKNVDPLNSLEKRIQESQIENELKPVDWNYTSKSTIV